MSPNEVICHGIPDKRPFEDGDIINLDVTVYTREGFHADLNETFLVGDVDADSLRLGVCPDPSPRSSRASSTMALLTTSPFHHFTTSPPIFNSKITTSVECAYECLRAAISMCKPGALYRDIGPTIDAVAREYRCGVNRTYCGHGIGRLFHTNPNVPHYAGNKAKGVMAVGHTFTIEPMVTLGKWKDVSWPDNWTAVTVDGKRSAQVRSLSLHFLLSFFLFCSCPPSFLLLSSPHFCQLARVCAKQFEHTMVVTETGVEILTARPGWPTDRLDAWDRSAWQRPGKDEARKLVRLSTMGFSHGLHALLLSRLSSRTHVCAHVDTLARTRTRTRTRTRMHTRTPTSHSNSSRKRPVRWTRTTSPCAISMVPPPQAARRPSARLRCGRWGWIRSRERSVMAGLESRRRPQRRRRRRTDVPSGIFARNFVYRISYIMTLACPFRIL